MSILAYAKYSLQLILPIPLILGFFLGGIWMWILGLGWLTVFISIGDVVFSPEEEEHQYHNSWVWDALLYLSIPFIFLVWVSFLWLFTQKNDIAGLGAWMSYLLSYDVFAAREANQWYHYVGAFLSCGLYTAGSAATIAHELVHQTTRKPCLILGRWLLGLILNPDFSIEHVYSHHQKVATWEDAGTARRGESYYAFLIRAIRKGHQNAWHIELSSLRKGKKKLFSLNNQMLQGYLMILVYSLLASLLVGSIVGALVFFVNGFLGKAILEAVNYIEHYGLIRIKGSPIQARHSWNDSHCISTTLLYSLTRHSSHHEKSRLRYWMLKPYPEAPQMRHGYLTYIYLALIPPLWHRHMAPKLLEWDEKYASREEKETARIQNSLSGISLLYDAGLLAKAETNLENIPLLLDDTPREREGTADLTLFSLV